MNCQECREELAAYIEGLLDETHQGQMETHMAKCSSCRAELEAVRELTVRLSREGLAARPVSLETVVMDRILHEQALQLRRLKMRKRIRLLGISGAMAATIAILMVLGLWQIQSAAAQKAIETQRAAQVLAKGAEAAKNPKTVHIVAKMRTLPNDNFLHIDADHDPVLVEIWTQYSDEYSDPQKWRLEKPGRVQVMDGNSLVSLIRPDHGFRIPHAVSTDAAGDSRFLLSLADVQDVVSRELKNAIAKGRDIKLTHETIEGNEKLVVTIQVKAEVPDNDYLKNKFFDDADTRRVYRFDARTQRLEGYDVYLQRWSGSEVLILTTERIEYDKPIDPVVFTLEMPKDVVWYKETERIPDNEKYEKMGPKETAQAFFEACGRADWEEVGKFYSPVTERTKNYLGGLKLVSLGEPFQSKGYAGGKGWFVPYEIRLVRKLALPVCNDNPAKRCVLAIGSKQAHADVKQLPDNEKYEKMTPKEAIRAFIDACKKGDWEEAQKFCNCSVTNEELQKHMKHLTDHDIHIGEPVPGKEPGHWSIPIEIHLGTKKHNLAVRKDNPAKRYVVDGGI